MAGFANQYGIDMGAIASQWAADDRNDLQKKIGGYQIKGMEREEENRNALRDYLPGAMAGDQEAFGKVLGADPKLGIGLMRRKQAMAKEDRELFAEQAPAVMKLFGGAKDEASYQQSRAAAIQAGIAQADKFPTTFDPNFVGRLMQTASAFHQPKYDIKEGDGGFFGIDQSNPGAPAVPVPGVAPKQARDPALQQKVEMLVQTGMPLHVAQGIAAGRLRVTRDPISGVAQIVDMATGKVSGPEAQQPAGEPSPAPTSSLSPDVDYSKGTGVGGLAAWGANTIMDIAGGKLPFPEAERASQGLTNLQVRTQTGLQSAIPGRPSNYLMERLDRLAVSPNSILTGDRRAFERLRQTQSMLKEEVERMDRDILKNPSGFTPKQVAETRANKSQIESILRDYDVVVGSFENAEKAKAGKGVIDDATRALIDKYK